MLQYKQGLTQVQLQNEVNSFFNSTASEQGCTVGDITLSEEEKSHLVEVLEKYSSEGLKVIGVNAERLVQHLGEGVASNFIEAKVDNSKRAFDAQVAIKYYRLYKSAVRRGLEFDLTFTDMKRLLRKTHCEYTGALFVEGCNEYKATFERVDENKGYVKGNVKMITHKANQFKSVMIDHGGNSPFAMPFEEMYNLLTTLKMFTFRRNK